MARAERLAKIARSEGWAELKEEYKRKRERLMKKAVHDYLERGQPVDQRHLDYLRGFFAGCDWILKNPDLAEKSVEEALSRATTIKDWSDS